MTELEKAQRAKMYMDKLANGIDPISDTEMPDDGTLNNVRLARCFFYVSDVLGQIIENGGTVKPAKRIKAKARPRFYLTEENRELFAYSAKPLRVTEIAKRLNSLVDTSEVRKLSPTVISNWLLSRGFLEQTTMPNGKKARKPTKQGEYIGLSPQLRQSPEGEYYAVMYNKDAQHFVIDHLDEILSRPTKKAQDQDKISSQGSHAPGENAGATP